MNMTGDKGRRIAAGAVLFLLVLLAADAVAMLARSPVTLTGAVRKYLQETEQPAAAAIVGGLLGVGMVWACGYGPQSPAARAKHLEARRQYAEGKQAQTVWEDSVACGEGCQARRERVQQAMEGAEAREAMAQPVNVRKQALWILGRSILIFCWGVLTGDVLFFATGGGLPSQNAFGAFAPGCLLSFCLSASLSHLTGWGPKFADLESGDV